MTQAGLVNNLNDGMAWGLFPLIFTAAKLGLAEIGWLAALYPAVWGASPLSRGWVGTTSTQTRWELAWVLTWRVAPVGVVAVAVTEPMLQVRPVGVTVRVQVACWPGANGPMAGLAQMGPSTSSLTTRLPSQVSPRLVTS